MRPVLRLRSYRIQRYPCSENDKGCRQQRKVRYAILEEHTPDVLSDKYSRVLKDAVIAMNIGQNIVVVKTIPGMAMAAAAALDAMKWSEILGCIAGDDTIMCAVKTSEQAPGVVQKLGGILSRGK